MSSIMVLLETFLFTVEESFEKSMKLILALVSKNSGIYEIAYQIGSFWGSF